MRRIGIVLGLIVGLVAGGQGCDAPTFWCVDDLEPGGEWSCHCKVVTVECDGMGDCMSECPIP